MKKSIYKLERDWSISTFLGFWHAKNPKDRPEIKSENRFETCFN